MIQYRVHSHLRHAILAGLVRYTFQLPPVPRAMPGQAIELIEDGSGKTIARAVCRHVARLEIVWTGNTLTKIREDGVALLSLTDCAKRLGHVDLDDMAAWFRATYGASYVEGFVVEWDTEAYDALMLEAAA